MILTSKTVGSKDFLHRRKKEKYTHTQREREREVHKFKKEELNKERLKERE